jgi:hypothetical protein
MIGRGAEAEAEGQTYIIANIRQGESKLSLKYFGAKTFSPDPLTTYYLLSVGILIVNRRRLYHRHSRSRGWAKSNPITYP